ncbi:MAG: hypothetical protein LBH25_10585 [Fibromonadaceae bacterium]|jgi:YD repeat-containing protein|nr:hypothetical protein [Fibromonadaceae bacterium]
MNKRTTRKQGAFNTHLLAATLALAITFTLSCSSDNNNGGGDPNNGGEYDVSSSSGGGGSLSSSGGGGNSSSSDGSNGGEPKVTVLRTETHVSYSSNGDVSFTYTHETMYEYDIKGNMIKRINSDGIYEYEYDSNGNQIKDVRYDFEGNIEARFESEYDSKGNRIKATGYNADGSVGARYEIEYDSNNNITKEATYSPDGIEARRYEYTWSNNGNTATRKRFDLRGTELTLINTFVYQFTTIDGKKLEASYTRENPDGTQEKRDNEYDSKGNITKSTDYELQNGVWVKTYQTTYVYTSI